MDLSTSQVKLSRMFASSPDLISKVDLEMAELRCRMQRETDRLNEYIIDNSLQLNPTDILVIDVECPISIRFTSNTEGKILAINNQSFSHSFQIAKKEELKVKGLRSYILVDLPNAEYTEQVHRIEAAYAGKTGYARTLFRHTYSNGAETTKGPLHEQHGMQQVLRDLATDLGLKGTGNKANEVLMGLFWGINAEGVWESNFDNVLSLVQVVRGEKIDDSKSDDFDDD